MHKGPEPRSHHLLLRRTLPDDLRIVNVLYTEGLLQRLMCIAYVWCALHAEQHDTYVLGNVHYLSVWSNAGAVQI